MLLLLQAATSVVLLVGTGLFVRSLRNVRDVDLGVDVNRLLTATIDLRSVGIDSAAADDYFERVRESVAKLPGVAAVTYADAAPFGDWSLGTSLSVPGRDSLPKHPESPYRTFVRPNYFATVGTRLVAGRSFTDADMAAGAPPVVIINEAIAEWIWPGQNAVGRCVRIGADSEPCSDVIGVAANTHRSNIVEDAAPLQVYIPLRGANASPRARMVIVRPRALETEALTEPLRRVMQTAVAGVPYANVRPMHDALDGELRPWQLGATMFAAFGLIALLLSSLGLYSVVAYTVAQRMHEMGVRVALGAQVADIRRLVLSQGLRIAALGVAGGTIIALLSGRFVASLLYRTSARDPVVYAIVIVLLLGVATVASLIPALRATRADPLVALRAE